MSTSHPGAALAQDYLVLVVVSSVWAGQQLTFPAFHVRGMLGDVSPRAACFPNRIRADFHETVCMVVFATKPRFNSLQLSLGLPRWLQ